MDKQTLSASGTTQKTKPSTIFNTRSNKKHRKVVKQLTTGNRVSEVDKVDWMNKLLNIVTTHPQLTVLKPVLKSLVENQHVCTKFREFTLGWVESGKVYLNPCLMNPKHKDYLGYIAPTVIAQLMRMTGDVAYGCRTEDFYTRMWLLPSGYTVEDDKQLNFLCEQYLVEFGTRQLCDLLHIRSPLGSDYLKFIEGRLDSLLGKSDFFFDTSDKVYQILEVKHSLQVLAKMYANFVLECADSKNKIHVKEDTKIFPTWFELIPTPSPKQTGVYRYD